MEDAEEGTILLCLLKVQLVLILEAPGEELDGEESPQVKESKPSKSGTHDQSPDQTFLDAVKDVVARFRPVRSELERADRYLQVLIKFEVFDLPSFDLSVSPGRRHCQHADPRADSHKDFRTRHGFDSKVLPLYNVILST